MRDAIKSLRFIGEPVDVHFQTPPTLEKSPDCPAAFTWKDENHVIVELLSRWTDFRRRGRMGQNMTPDHAQTAARRGSWGVGRFYFQVRTRSGRLFELYYDRAPAASGGNRKGGWFLFKELADD